jgi:hypothetical protein
VALDFLQDACGPADGWKIYEELGVSSPSTFPAAWVTGMVDHSQDEDMIRPPRIEDPERESAQNGAADVCMDNRKGLRMSTDLDQCLIQVLLEREVQA